MIITELKEENEKLKRRRNEYEEQHGDTPPERGETQEDLRASVLSPDSFTVVLKHLSVILVFCVSVDSEKLKKLLQTSETEKSKLQTEVNKLKKELENFDPTFFEEIEDLKYNYNLEVKKNVLLEEELKKVCDQFGVKAEMPSVSIS